MEEKILSGSFTSREFFDNIISYITEDDIPVGPARIIWNEVVDYYSTDKEAKSCDKDIILARLERKLNDNQLKNIKSIVNRFEPISFANVEREIIEFKRYDVANKLASCLIAGDYTTSRELIDQFELYDSGELEQEEKTNEVHHATRVSEIVSHFNQDNLVKLYPIVLNNILDGGVVKPTNVAIFARPEVGKSLFSINMAAGNCRDGWRTLFIDNEDPLDQTILRFVSRMSEMSKYEIINNPDEANDRALEKGYGNLVVASLAPGTIPEIEQLMQQYEPDVVYINQVRNLYIPKSDGLVQQLERASGKIRNLGKKYNCVTVQITQAGDSATNKLILAMNDVDNSKTGFQASFDLMIGIGMDMNYEASNRRMVNLPKNKVSGRHEAFPVTVDPILNRVRSI